MIKEIYLFDTPTARGTLFLHDAPEYYYWNTSWSTERPRVILSNEERHMSIQYTGPSAYQGFMAKITHGPSELINVEVLVDIAVLEEACLTGKGVTLWQNTPLEITGDFIWKKKGKLKLCYV